MSEKELLVQLNNLKKVKPEPRWKKENQDILFKKVFGSQAKSKIVEFSWLKAITQKLPIQAARSISQPTMVVIFILVFMLGSGILSLKAARGTKPGDSFYIAKIISEKTQLVLTFNEKEKALLGIEFAGNRAEEITQVLAEPDNGEKEKKVEKLVNNFKKEIKVVKTRLEKISPGIQGQRIAQDEKEVREGEGIVAEEAEEDVSMFSANLGKEDNGIQISEPEPKTDESPKQEEAEVAESESEDLSPTTTPAMVPDTETNDPQLILKQAEELLNQEDYDATLSKLEEAGQAINQVNIGQVKGESEGATTTDIQVDAEDNSLENKDDDQASPDQPGEVLGVEEKEENNQVNNEADNSASSTVD